MWRPFYSTLLLLTAIFFKLSFYNVALAANSPIIQEIADQSVFKVGKKRRRILAGFSKRTALIVGEEDAAAGKKEDEETQKIFKKLKFPSLVFFSTLVRSQAEVAFSRRQGTFNFFDALFPVILKPYLSVSVLRI